VPPALIGLSERARALLLSPLDPGHRLHWAYLAAFVLLALHAWRRDRPPGGFLRFLLPPAIWRHRSTRTDLQIFVANALLGPAAALLGGFGSAWLAVRLATAFDLVVGRPTAPLPWGPAATAACTVGLLIATDAAHFLNHVLHHRVRLLWPLHAVHHSAEVLTPLTLFRKHPLYDVVKLAVEAPLVGLFQAGVLVASGGRFEIWTVAGINGLYAAFLLLGANARHSHVWIDWGPRLDRFFVSPAMHQVHHSPDPRHVDRNFGSILAIWDRALGTLYVPDGPEALRFGLGEAVGQPHDGLIAAWFGPLRDVLDALRGRPSRVGGPTRRSSC
jgi:sterol desaturase/sphingolipid hydroxylase (fatty acid hydroxylase superfamily)